MSTKEHCIDIVEIFGEHDNYAIQGEGKFAGFPSVFIRTFGCNLRCAFGLESKEQIQQWETTARGYADKYDKLEDLPVTAVGCDTYYSLWPEFRKFITKYTLNQIVDNIHGRCDNFGNNVHLVITGGEPLLPGNQQFLMHLVEMTHIKSNVKHITFETNATQELIADFEDSDFIPKINFSMSPKMSCAGYAIDEICNPDIIRQYINCAHGNGGEAWFKFVVNNSLDIMEIMQYLKKCELQQSDIDIYLMPEGGTAEQFKKNEEKVYNLCAKFGFCYSPRHQVSIMNNGIGI